MRSVTVDPAAVLLSSNFHVLFHRLRTQIAFVKVPPDIAITPDCFTTMLDLSSDKPFDLFYFDFWLKL